jgi:hypothetical protein
MDSIKISATENSPNVILDAENGIFEISGKSLPEDVNAFYDPVLEWLDKYEKTPLPKTVFVFKLDYLNTASSKSLFAIFLKLEKMHSEGKQVLIKWYYADDDEDMKDVGEEYADIIKVPFEHIAYSLD